MLGGLRRPRNKRGDGFNIARDDKLHPRYLGWHRTSPGSELLPENTTKPSLQTALVPPMLALLGKHEFPRKLRRKTEITYSVCLGGETCSFVLSTCQIYPSRKEEKNRIEETILRSFCTSTFLYPFLHLIFIIFILNLF